jgi:hypothetical protein
VYVAVIEKEVEREAGFLRRISGLIKRKDCGSISFIPCFPCFLWLNFHLRLVKEFGYLTIKVKWKKRWNCALQGAKFLIESTYRERVFTDSFLKSP